MKYNHFNYNAFELWELCTNASDSQAQEVFWSDIVLHVKANPGRAVFFENLFKELKIVDDQDDKIKEPLDIASKKLLAFAVYFDSDFWSKIIKNWAKINIELKIRAQTLLLQRPSLIKEFLISVLDEQKNPKTVINNIAKESALLTKYAKNDVVLMLCHIIAESFEDYQTDDKEIKSVMNDGIFQMADEMIEIENQDLSEQNPTAQLQTTGTKIENDDTKVRQLKDVCEEFVLTLNHLNIVDNEWEIVEAYLEDARKIAIDKNSKRQEMLKRRRVVDDFTNKLNYFKDAFCLQLDNLAIQLPCPDVVDGLDNNALESATASLNVLQDLMNKYKTLSQEKSGNIAQEKKRLGLLYTVMTDIETIVQSFFEVLSSEVPLSTQNDVVEELVEDEAEQAPEQAEQQEHSEQQIDLFMTKVES